MFKKTTTALAAGLMMTLSANTVAADGHGEITVAYFLACMTKHLA